MATPPAADTAVASIDPRQLAEYRDAFSMFDRNGDGNIELSELRDVMSSLGPPPSDVELNAIISAADTDGSGTIEFEEFVDVMVKKQQQELSSGGGGSSRGPAATAIEVASIFYLLDRDGDGLISLEDLRAAVAGVSWGSTEQQPNQAGSGSAGRSGAGLSEEALRDMASMRGCEGGVDLATFRRIVLPAAVVEAIEAQEAAAAMAAPVDEEEAAAILVPTRRC
jgi:Ca2+-binding EF-hand superfamily protein